ncbi:hemolymph lipopolysaccharide-binding protein [Anabrus simplex]|uniref:hemolymph lipopolysaccharide-binding protein n=1 Tax=Anabrus simplex TaxID=316456 RepID=UPI0035A264BB
MEIYWLVWSSLLALAVRGTSQDITSGSEVSNVKLLVSSLRNLTGHRIVSVDMLTLDSDQVRKPKQVNLEMEHGVAACREAKCVHLTAIVTVSGSSPPDGYEVINGLGYYKMYTTPVTWDQARENCGLDGAHLIVINSEQEADVVRTLFARHPKIPGATREVYAHIGFHDRYTEGKYVTLLGDTLEKAGYAIWDRGQPEKSTSQNCGYASRDAKFHDGPCEWKLAYVCEFASE